MAQSFWILPVALLSLLGTTGSLPTEQVDTSDKEVETVARKVLWKALLQACPEDCREIAVYGENPSLTAVCFWSKDRLFFFTKKDARVEELKFMKVLPTINRITFEEEQEQNRGWWVLWTNGQMEMRFSGSK